MKKEESLIRGQMKSPVRGDIMVVERLAKPHRYFGGIFVAKQTKIVTK